MQNTPCHVGAATRGDLNVKATMDVRWTHGPAQASRRTMSQLGLLLEERERLLNEGGMVLEDAAVPGVGENAQLCIRQPAGEFE